MSFEKDCNFDLHKEVNKLRKILIKEDCFYHWYIFDDRLINTLGWVDELKNRVLNEETIYDFVKENYNKTKDKQ